MSEIKKLAGQTLWYGLPTIVNRFLGYLMNLTLPLFFAQPATTADLTQVYALIPFLNILFTYGLETGYFKFAQNENKTRLYNTLSLSLFATTIILTVILWLLKGSIVSLIHLEQHPEYINWMIGILFFDTISTLAFAKLRLENRPRRYAMVRVVGVIVNILVVVSFMVLIPKYAPDFDTNILPGVNNDSGIVYYLIGNFLGSVVTFLLLSKEYREVKIKFSPKLWLTVMQYSYPLIIVGMGGMVNDLLSRLVYQDAVNLPTEQAKHELGIFSNIYRLAVLITIMIQAFRMAAEPFFFNQSSKENAQKVYAKIMKFFVIACCFMFLGISLYIDVFSWLFIAIQKENWVEGLWIVPMLALGNIFLGIYYNLGIWYRLTNNNMKGAYITLIGAAITVVLNLLLIPVLHYFGAAIATFTCYLVMMIISYKMGQKYYPVPYAVKKLIAYIIIAIVLYLLHRLLVYYFPNRWINISIATILFSVYFVFVAKIEKNEFLKIPVLNKLVRLI